MPNKFGYRLARYNSKVLGLSDTHTDMTDHLIGDPKNASLI